MRSRTRAAPSRGGFDPRVKLAGTLVFVLLVSLSHQAGFLWLCATTMLVVLGLGRAETMLTVLKAAVPAGAFTFLVLLPSALGGNWAGEWMITAKVLVSVSAVRLLSATTEWRRLTRSLASFRVPDLFVFVLDFAVRSILLLGTFSLDLLHSLRLRSVGRDRDPRGSLSGVAGSLFLRSHQVVEETYAAMECRCFTGSYRASKQDPLRARDAALIACILVCIGTYAWLGV